MVSRRVGLALVVIGVLGVLVAGCGGGSDPTGEELAKKVNDVISQPGMVFHAVANDGSEVWIDAPDQLYLKKAPTAQGGFLSSGQGWNTTSYDPVNNTVAEKDQTPPGPSTPRINNPAVLWSEPLGALGFGNTLSSAGESSADGHQIWIVLAKSPIVDSNNNITGSLDGRVEIDTATNLPHAYERHETESNGTTPTPGVGGIDPNRRIVYTTSEMIPRSSLAADFFDAAKVNAEVKTPEENLDKIRALGLTPLWLGQLYHDTPGVLQLGSTNPIRATAAKKSGELHYSLLLPASQTTASEEPDAVVIRLALDATTFTSPPFPQLAGDLPEQKDTVTVNGQPATLYSSQLTPDDLPCTASSCPPSSVALYRRLDFVVGTTNVQIEAQARIDTAGKELNGYNGKDTIIALAEALTEAPESIATPTPAPGPLATPAPSG